MRSLAGTIWCDFCRNRESVFRGDDRDRRLTRAQIANPGEISILPDIHPFPGPFSWVNLLRMKICAALVILLLTASPVCAQEPVPANARLVSFPAPGGTLQGFLYVPDGAGPFPAVLWNHGSEKRPGAQPELAEFYNSHGFVFFLPHRHGQGRSPGIYIMDEIQGSHGGRTVAVQAQEVANQDVVAAMTLLARRKRSIPIAWWSQDAPSEAFRLSWLLKKDLAHVLSLLLHRRRNPGAMPYSKNAWKML